MKEEKNKLEEKIREKLYNHSAEVPEQLWEGISKGVAAKGAGTTSLFWKLGMYTLIDLALLIGFAPLLSKSMLAEKKASYNSEFIQDKKVIQEITPIKNPSKTSEQQEQKIAESSQNKSSHESEQDKNLKLREHHQVVHEQQKELAQAITKTGSSKSSISKENPAMVAIPMAVQTRKYAQKSNGKKIENENDNPISEKTLASFEKETTQNESSVKEQQLNISNQVDPTILPSTSEEPKVEVALPAPNLTPQNNVASEKKEIAKLKIDNVDSTSPIINANLAETLPTKNATLVSKDSTEEIKKIKNWTVEIFASPDFYFLHNSNQNGASLAGRMDSAGINKKAWSVGMLASYKLSKNWAVKAGFNYNSLHSNYAIDKSSTYSEIYVDSVSSYYTLQDPFSLPLVLKNYDTLSITKNKSEILESDLKFSWLQIPVLAEYKMEFSKFSIGLEGGINFSILFKQKGKEIQAETLSESAVQDATSVAFRKNLGLGYSVGLSLNYALSKNFFLSLAPHYNSYFNAVTREEYGLNQRWKKLGCRAGIGYNF